MITGRAEVIMPAAMVARHTDARSDGTGVIGMSKQFKLSRADVARWVQLLRDSAGYLAESEGLPAASFETEWDHKTESWQLPR